jgi:putative addiction module component (TIGR02574 family)
MRNAVRPSSSKRVRRVLSEAMELTEEERLDVATELLATLDGPDSAMDDDAWLAEIRRRAERVARGESTAIPWTQAKQQILEQLRGR